MLKKSLCFHTCKNENTEEYILQNAPFHSNRAVSQWLGQGYYLWTDSDYFAHEWGKLPPRNNKYVIIKFDFILDNEEELLDLVGNVNDQLTFRNLVELYKDFLKKAISETTDRMKRINARNKLNEISVSTVITFFQRRQGFPYKAVKAQDLDSSQTSNLQFVADSTGKKSFLSYPARQQIVVYEWGKEILNNPEIYFTKS